MKSTLRTLIAVLAAIALVLPGVALAQDDDPSTLVEEILEEKAACEAQGGAYMMNPLGRFCEVDGVTTRQGSAEPTPVEPTEVEATQTEPAPSAELPATQPSTAQQTAPQFTG